MLKISEMAKLANTTRRTLIFYDQENIFKPSKKTEAGYRYYDYNQLYDLMFILGLRSLDIPIAEIKAIKIHSKGVPAPQLLNAQNKIDKKIDELIKIQNVINKKIEDQSVIEDTPLYQPKIEQRIKTIFWCSRQSVSCTEEEVAQLFSEFYKQLDSLAVMDTAKSGFLTTLSVNNPNGYAEASFRIIKEKIDSDHKVFIPIMEKNAGSYACILVENNEAGIHQGLTKLKSFCQKNKLKTADYLWQLNSGATLIETGASKYGWLEFAIFNEKIE
ncbi:transcriptional regulator [Enterococcus silesiacus]|uniref:Transcriptional regulator n=1 Tax=Enterococcus silesiacus TaxID=332949 RepID=A0A0S3KCL8_9ENTE|nr:MerR family transcriptional regulator [Enterococcus silesiacus]ALS02070.1 transcriptional regulator [Enterococcus silesiacus]OJG91565.1 transcriptional regulator [Enterococcus silesiacus]